MEEEPEILTLSSDDEDADISCNSNKKSEDTKKKFIQFFLNEKEPMISNNLKIHDFEISHQLEEEPLKNLETLSHESQYFNCRSVRIGSLKVVPEKEIQFVNNGLQMTVKTCCEGTSDCVTFTIKINTILKILAHFQGTLPLIILYLLPEGCEEIRNELKMKNKSSFYFDSCSEDESHRRIILLFDKMNFGVQTALTIFLNYKIYNKLNGKTENLLEEITLKEANEILTGSSPTESEDPDSSIHSISAAYSKFVYPPPPMKGGITITYTDFFCLKEGEFLNDVLIDFYFKWLMLNKLNEDNQQQTHMFSSFFYRRLTFKPKRDRKSGSFNEDPFIPPSIRRHSRVKSWTKNVDIFTKDFLLIPINEKSHWILAVICFPGLTGPVDHKSNEPIPVREGSRKSSRKIIKTIPIEDDDEEFSDRDEAEGNDNELEEDDEDEEEEAPPNKKQKMNHIKQPCILIFDSMPTRSRSNIVATLREYLSLEYKAKKNETRTFNQWTMPGSIPKVPIQDNFSDCGIFVLQFAEYFFKTPIKDFNLPIRGLCDWFCLDEVAGKRQYLANLIQSLNPNENNFPDIHFENEAEEENGDAEINNGKKEKNLDIKVYHRRSTSKAKPPKVEETIPGIGDDCLSENSFVTSSLFNSCSKKDSEDQSIDDKKPEEEAVTTTTPTTPLITKYFNFDKLRSPKLPKIASVPVNSVTLNNVDDMGNKPKYLKNLQKSTKLHSALSNSSSLKLLADTYGNSDDTQSSEEDNLSAGLIITSEEQIFVKKKSKLKK